MPESATVTRQLHRWSEEGPSALNELLPLVIADLRRIAGAYFRREDQNHALQPTALVNEAYLRMLGWRKVSWDNRRQFFGFAAKLMRQILMDAARQRDSLKRGSEAQIVSLSTALGGVHQVLGSELDHDQLIDLSRAVEKLRKLDPQEAQVVEQRYFNGLTVNETAEVLGISRATANRDWLHARKWLARELEGDCKVE